MCTNLCTSPICTKVIGYLSHQHPCINTSLLPFLPPPPCPLPFLFSSLPPSLPFLSLSPSILPSPSTLSPSLPLLLPPLPPPSTPSNSFSEKKQLGTRWRQSYTQCQSRWRRTRKALRLSFKTRRTRSDSSRRKYVHSLTPLPHSSPHFSPHFPLLLTSMDELKLEEALTAQCHVTHMHTCTHTHAHI